MLVLRVSLKAEKHPACWLVSKRLFGAFGTRAENALLFSC